jgi:hypothetical protein
MTPQQPKKSDKPTSTGVGDSKIFAAPDGTFEPLRDWSTLTVNGEPIPENLWATLPYRFTDQGYEELNGGPKVRAQVVAGPKEKGLERMRDFRMAAPPEDCDLQADPMKELVNTHIPPGMHGRFLSARRVGKEGNGTRGYEIVRNEKGEPVKYGSMILGQIPQEIADSRGQRNVKRSRDQEQAIRQRPRELRDELNMRELDQNFERQERHMQSGYVKQPDDLFQDSATRESR